MRRLPEPRDTPALERAERSPTAPSHGSTPSALGLAILATIANSHTQSLFHSGVHNASVALTKGFDRAFLVGAGFALAGAILAFVLISSRDSREHSVAARSGDPAPAAAAG